MKNRIVILWCAAAGVLASCAPMPAPAPRPENGSAGAPAEEPAPIKHEPAPLPPAPLAAPLSAQQAQKAIAAAAGYLDLGQEEPAKAELQRILAGEPNHKTAQSMMRQITADPVSLLGRESFAYTVKPNESMSSIAQRFLGDRFAFYALARYNNIAVPKQLASGQTLRIPGKAPPPEAAPAPAPVAVAPPPPPPPAAPAPPPPPPPPPERTPGELAMASAQSAEKLGDLERAMAEYTRAGSLAQPGADSKAAQLRKQLAQRYTLEARTANAKQDLDGAIRAWDKVLRVDPANSTAKLERQRAQDLKEKLGKL